MSLWLWGLAIYVILLLLFSILYATVGVFRATHSVSSSNIELETLPWWEAFFVSANTQTFLGYGGWEPASTVTRLCIALQALMTCAFWSILFIMQQQKDLSKRKL